MAEVLRQTRRISSGSFTIKVTVFRQLNSFNVKQQRDVPFALAVTYYSSDTVNSEAVINQIKLCWITCMLESLVLR